MRMTSFAEALKDSPESQRYFNDAINSATPIKEMNRKMDEMYQWGTVRPLAEGSGGHRNCGRLGCFSGPDWSGPEEAGAKCFA